MRTVFRILSLYALLVAGLLLSCGQDPQFGKALSTTVVIRDTAGVAVDTLLRLDGDTLQLYAQVDHPGNVESLRFTVSDSTGTILDTLISLIDTLTDLPGVLLGFEGPYHVQLTISVAGILSEQHLDVRVGHRNRLPNWQDDADTIDFALQETVLKTLYLDSLCSDPEDSSLTFYHNDTLAPDWCEGAVSARVLVLMPGYSDAGVYCLPVRASDGMDTSSTIFRITVLDSNRRPVLSADSLQFHGVEMDTLKIGYALSDPDSESLSIRLKSIFPPPRTLPTVDPLRKQLLWVPANNDHNTYNMVLEASDGKDTVTTGLTVIVADRNVTPFLHINGTASAAKYSLIEGDTLSLRLEALDPDTLDLAHISRLLNTPFADSVGGYFSFNTKTGILKITPDYSIAKRDSTVYAGPMGIVVDDGDTADTIFISFEIVDSNTAPVVSDSAISLDEEGSVAVVVHASDIDGDGLGWEIIDSSQFGFCSVDSGTVDGLAGFTYQPFNQLDSFVDSVSIRVSDGILADTAWIRFAVAADNDAPVIDSIQSIMVDEDDSVGAFFDISCHDPENQTLFWALISGPDSGRVDTVENLISNGHEGRYVPGLHFFGVDSFVVVLSDGVHLSNTDTVHVAVSHVNVKPRVTGPTRTLATDEDLSLTLVLSDFSVVDPDNAFPAQFSLKIHPGSSYTVLGSVITPAFNYHGTLQVAVRVFDSEDSSAVFSCPVTVREKNQKPVFVSGIYTDSIRLGDTLRHTLTWADADSEQVTVSLLSDTSVVQLDTAAGQHRIRFFADPLAYAAPDTVIVSLHLADTRGGTHDTSFVLRILPHRWEYRGGIDGIVFEHLCATDSATLLGFSGGAFRISHDSGKTFPASPTDSVPSSSLYSWVSPRVVGNTLYWVYGLPLMMYYPYQLKKLDISVDPPLLSGLPENQYGVPMGFDVSSAGQYSLAASVYLGTSQGSKPNGFFPDSLSSAHYLAGVGRIADVGYPPKNPDILFCIGDSALLRRGPSDTAFLALASVAGNLSFPRLCVIGDGDTIFVIDTVRNAVCRVTGCLSNSAVLSPVSMPGAVKVRHMLMLTGTMGFVIDDIGDVFSTRDGFLTLSREELFDLNNSDVLVRGFSLAADGSTVYGFGTVPGRSCVFRY